MNKIKITGDGHSGTTKIFLGDMDISRYVQRVEIVMSVDYEFPEVRLYCIGDVDLPGELQATVITEVEE